MVVNKTEKRTMIYLEMCVAQLDQHCQGQPLVNALKCAVRFPWNMIYFSLHLQ